MDTFFNKQTTDIQRVYNWKEIYSFIKNYKNDNLEFNFEQDVDAVRIVFESKVKLTVIPCKNYDK